MKEQALRSGAVTAEGIRASGGPLPPASPTTGYYGTPLFHEPTWTWEIPLYFFVGGAAGVSAIIGVTANINGLNDLSHDARLIAAAGSVLSGVLLVSDLGRPGRFLNMLRVIKLQSPMSVGAWTLLTFSTAAGVAGAASLIDQPGGNPPLRLLGDCSAILSALTGAVMATYTGVLVGATVIPVWATNVRTLPAHFGASSVASAASLLEICGHRQRGLGRLATLAAAAETAAAVHLHVRTDRSLEPLKRGLSGALTTTGALLSGPIPLALRLLGSRSVRSRQLAAVSSIAGSLLTRYAWVSAGKASSRDSSIPLRLDRPASTSEG
ncbi:MAG: NrfD/PsrC family molybdoenzyme membrane anchor subunit [Acidobacteriota bacterium]